MRNFEIGISKNKATELKFSFNRFSRYLVYLLIALFTIATFDVQPVEARAKRKTTKVVKKKKKSRRKKSRRSRRRRRTKTVTRASITENTTMEEKSVDTLAPGVVYKKLLIGDETSKFAVHLIEADMTDPLNDVAVLKAGKQISELVKLQRINHEYDSLHTHRSILASINANFWKAYTNYPIGPMISGGEVVELNSYKNWSSGFFDTHNRLYIDRFEINGSIRLKNGTTITIDAVNRRSETNQIVVYNCFGGDSIPYISTKKVSKDLDEAISAMTIDMADSSDMELDTMEVQKQLQSSRRMETIEYALPKVSLRYLTPPAVNKKIKCVVVSIDSFTVKMPDRGAVLSLGVDFPKYNMPRVGDTLNLKYETNVMSKTIFTEAVCGTPRLVRDGVAKHEAEIEGSRARRFISSALPRTAIGTDEEQTTLYYVVVEPSNSQKRVCGASLADIAKIMELVGCYDAMNLDGGGSSIMVIDEENLLYPMNTDACRRLSAGLSLVRKEKSRYYKSVNKEEITNNPLNEADPNEPAPAVRIQKGGEVEGEN